MLSHLGVSSSYAADLLPALVLFGAGAGLTVSSAVNSATSVVEQADAGVASAMVNTSQMIGGSIGTALLNSLAVSAVAGYLATHAGQSTRSRVRRDPQLRRGLHDLRRSPPDRVRAHRSARSR